MVRFYARLPHAVNLAENLPSFKGLIPHYGI
jgi:hypothetical protein